MCGIGGKSWNDTLLIITYSEHGGLPDHVRPPAVTRPDSLVSREGFKFDTLGIRVPCVLVSPFIRPHTVLRRLPGQEPFDHTSLLSTVRAVCGLEKLCLGEREAVAPNLLGCLTLSAPRDPAAADVPSMGANWPKNSEHKWEPFFDINAPLCPKSERYPLLAEDRLTSVIRKLNRRIRGAIRALTGFDSPLSASARAAVAGADHSLDLLLSYDDAPDIVKEVVDDIFFGKHLEQGDEDPIDMMLTAVPILD